MSFKKYLISFLLLFLSIPQAIYAYSNYLIASGENIGIKVNLDGVVVVGLYNINNSSPGKDAGLKIGDIIKQVDEQDINNIDDLLDSITNKSVVNIKYLRNDKLYNTQLKLYKDNNEYKTGLYVKDSIMGIGTLTYIDPETKIFGALGHEITDKNTNDIVKINNGNIFESKVTSIDKSYNGTPGSKNAKFNFNNIYGDINKNTKKGIFGTYNDIININSSIYEVGNIDDINLGKAQILTVLDGNEVKAYDINIIKINKNDVKNILFEITDNEILDKANGIVQGMSGSPIIQNNKIIGAVTHVIVDNPKNGYGIFITNMLKEGEN